MSSYSLFVQFVSYISADVVDTMLSWKLGQKLDLTSGCTVSGGCPTTEQYSFQLTADVADKCITSSDGRLFQKIHKILLSYSIYLNGVASCKSSHQWVTIGSTCTQN